MKRLLCKIFWHNWQHSFEYKREPQVRTTTETDGATTTSYGTGIERISSECKRCGKKISY